MQETHIRKLFFLFVSSRFLLMEDSVMINLTSNFDYWSTDLDDAKESRFPISSRTKNSTVGIA